MFASVRRRRLRLSRQQSQRTTRPGRSQAGFQPVSSQSGQDINVPLGTVNPRTEDGPKTEDGPSTRNQALRNLVLVQLTAKPVGLPRSTVRAQLDVVIRLVDVELCLGFLVELQRDAFDFVGRLIRSHRERER